MQAANINPVKMVTLKLNQLYGIEKENIKTTEVLIPREFNKRLLSMNKI